MIRDVLDYRILRAVASYHALPPHAAPVADPLIFRAGWLSDVQQAITAAEGDAQAGWNQALVAYLDGDVSLARAAELLGLSRFELADRFQRLGLPLQIGPGTGEEARREFAAFGR